MTYPMTRWSQRLKSTTSSSIFRKKAAPNRTSTTRSACISCRWARSRCSPRQDEISSARRIEETRTRFRHLLLGNDFVLHAAVELLEKVQAGELRLDRTIEISVTNTAEKKRTLKRLAPNLATIKHLLRLNQADFRIAIDKRLPKAEKHAAWRRLVVRRNKIVRLVEELNLRLGKLMPIMQQLHKIGERMVTIKQQLAEPEKLISDKQHVGAAARAPLPDADHAGIAGHAGPPRRLARSSSATSTTRPSACSRPPTCGWWCRSPSGTATAA